MRIGILTHYYNSTNYGGSLQAYALCKTLEQMGHQAHQICIDHSDGCYNLLDNSKLAPLKRLLGKPVKRCIKATMRHLSPNKQKAHILKQQRHNSLLAAFASFNQNLTPHSQTVYTSKTIGQAVDQYDAFITGSDQVWNPIWYFPSFFLDFVPQGKIKLAYAASIAQDTLPPHVQTKYKEHLKDFTAVSVREEAAVPLLEELVPGKVQCVLDPTLLLSPQDWAQVSAPRQIEKPYVFCYFLGDDPSTRKAAAQYAKLHNLTLVNIPNAAGLIHLHDKDFGDIAIADPSVEVFLSLIQHAQYVFTDSFHASVFSLIHQRQFLVFPRNSHKAMGSRLRHLTNLFEIPEHFCCCSPEEYWEYIQALPSIDYTITPSTFAAAKQHSLDYLQSHLSGIPKDLT